MAEAESAGVIDERRDALLLKMYDQMFNDIDRHILVIWQSIGVLIGAFAVFALAEKHVVSLDVATSVIVLLAGWLVAHLYDASYWYNRNLVIIANIERQFLRRSDLKDIHYYFGAHRLSGKMITHLRIQYALAVGITLIVLYAHFSKEVVPGFALPFTLHNINLSLLLPYLTLVFVVIYISQLRARKVSSYDEFMRNSPGVSIDTVGIEYGVGHGYPKIKTRPDTAVSKQQDPQ